MPRTLAPIHPGEMLREELMKPLGISINALARALKVPVMRISNLVNEKQAVTADTALRLSRYFGMSAEMWVNLQADYDLRMARRAAGKKIERAIRPRQTEAA